MDMANVVQINDVCLSPKLQQWYPDLIYQQSNQVTQLCKPGLALINATITNAFPTIWRPKLHF